MVDLNLILPEKNLILFKIWSDFYGVIQRRDVNDLTNLNTELNELISEAKVKNASKVFLRLNSVPHETAINALNAFGFEKKSKRIEFKTSIDRFDFKANEQLKFLSVKEAGINRDELAQIVKEISFNDPDFNPDEDCYEFTDDWYHDPILTSGEDYIFVGFDALVPVSLVVTQVDLAKGWGRLSYIGVFPQFRNKKIGKLTHQFGIMKLKEIGAIVYHGGTNALNNSMLDLFQKNGCDFFRSQEEWECVLK